MYIEGEDVGIEWAQVFMELIKPGIQCISPLTVTITGFNDDHLAEQHPIRKLLDEALTARAEADCKTVANTIFPNSYWNRRQPRTALYGRYLRNWPQIKRHPANRNGTYFQRLISFPRVDEGVNQLEHIINTFRAGNHRKSALQAAIFDPTRDHTNQRQRGFPCMQHVFFTPHGNELDVMGVYATQHIFRKAYGNYLGLCRLGQFMAQEMGLYLRRVICYTNLAVLGVPKNECTNVAAQIQDVSYGEI
jgi:thymidylate synthase